MKRILLVGLILFLGCSEKPIANSVVELNKNLEVAGWHNHRVYATFRIPFKLNQVKVDKKYLNDIKKIAQFINLHSNIREVEVIGYTDNTGSSEYNKRLSLKRAKSVANLLIKFGVNPRKIIVKGLGEKNPLVPNNGVEKKLNRRVEIILRD